MDIQKVNRSDPSTAELNMSHPHLVDEPKSVEQYQTKIDNQFSSCNQNRSKRSFDVAFLMMPDEKMKQKQMEKQLRVSKQLFNDSHYARMEADNFRKNHEYLNKSHVYVHREADDSKGTDLSTTSCYSEKYRHNNNLSPQSNQDLNIDVGTEEFATKSVLSDSDVSDMSRSRPNSTESFSRPVRVIHESPFRNKVFDDPSLISQTRPSFEHNEKYMAARLSEVNPRSAFTKVTHSLQENTTTPSAPSPGHSESPDNLSYQNSMSPPLNTASPPMLSHLFSKNQQFKSLIPSNHPLLSSANPFFKNQGIHPYHQFSDHHGHVSNHSENPSFSKSSPPNFGSHHKTNNNDNEKPMQFAQSNKFGNLLPFRPDLPPYLQSSHHYPFPMQNFHHHPGAEFLKFQQQQGEAMNPLMRNPAAAILSTLLPPSLATLSLPAQNVCAKCNISFRMTSDLVYHMRSHHKSEVNYDATRRKREDKLKCPVCAESFRERHHLTRHMTAHQDKEGDILDHQLDPSEPGGSSFCSKGKSRPYYSHSSGMQSK